MHRLRARDRMGPGLPYIELHTSQGFYPDVGASVRFKTTAGAEYIGEAVRTNDCPARGLIAFYAAEQNRLFYSSDVVAWQLSAVQIPVIK